MGEDISGILVGARAALERNGGGVQQASREYIAALDLAGWKLEIISFEIQATLLARIWNRIRPAVMLVQMPEGLTEQVDRCVRAVRPQFIFFYGNIFPELSRSLRLRFPEVLQVLLSYGVESIDFCVDQQIRRRDRAESRSRGRVERMLGQQVLDEAEQRSLIDAVLTMSPLEAEVEKWLGARRALWLPRTIMEPIIAGRPTFGHVGCVSTLNHPPNLDGLLQLLEQLEIVAPPNFRFRLVGGPNDHGRRLATRFRFVDYLGRLDDAALREEAVTWCCFVHPLFVYAKGSSTKLAVALGWGLPVATTEFGARGYCWDSDAVPLARTPKQLAELVISYAHSERYDSLRLQTARIVAQTPTLETVAKNIRHFLLTQTDGA